MKAAVLPMALALAVSAPLAAQEAEPQNLPAPVPVAPAAAFGLPPEPGDIILLEASPRLTALFDLAVPLDPAREICLEQGETAVLASDRALFQLSGPRCDRLADAERQAATEEFRLSLPEPVPERGPHDSEAKIATARPMPKRVRVGAARPSVTARPVLFRVAAGSPAVLRLYPVGTVLPRGAQVCLDDREQLSIASSNGQQVTYRGPGCMRRNAPPSRDNIGGLTFG